ncbi:MAG: hypothetical protein ACU843_00640 [Gammaproteobacteria bacterium]
MKLPEVATLGMAIRGGRELMTAYKATPQRLKSVISLPAFHGKSQVATPARIDRRNKTNRG